MAENSRSVGFPIVMRASLLAALTLVILGGSCAGRRTKGASPSRTASTSPNPEDPSPEAVTDYSYSSFTGALEAAGFRVRPSGRERSSFLDPFFSVPGQAVFINDVGVSTYEYPNERALGEVRSTITPRGDTIGGAIINWSDPPRFYGAGKLLVLYFGDRRRTLEALELLLGPPFAGS